VSTATTTLDHIQPGQQVTITDCNVHTLPVKLMEMGLLPGVRVKVIRFAPFGDPIDLQIRGYHLSLRKSEAAQISVCAA